MTRFYSPTVAGLLWIAVVLGCDRATPARSNDTPAPTPSPPPGRDSAVTMQSPWDSAAGPVMLIAAATATQASVVLPEFPSDASLDTIRTSVSPARGLRYDLLGNGLVLGSGRVLREVGADTPDDCTAWPLVQLATDSLARSWVVGFVADRVRPIAFDSISGLSSRDSSRVAIEVARLASSVPGDTAAELRGLPYQVRHAYRFTVRSVEVLVAEILRTLNQEANPRQEHLFVIAERDSSEHGAFSVAYAERVSGSEETIEATELLTVARPALAQEPFLVLARYVGDGATYALVTRTGSRRWRLQWSSPYAGC